MAIGEKDEQIITHNATKVIGGMRNDAYQDLLENKAARRKELEELTQICHELQEKHNLGARIETLHIIGIAFGVVEALVDSSLPYAGVITGAAKIPETSAKILGSFNDAEKQRIQSSLEVLRQGLTDNSRTYDKKMDDLRKFDQVINNIIEAKNRELQAIVRN